MFFHYVSLAKALHVTSIGGLHCWNYTATYKWDKINHSSIILKSSFVVFCD